METDKGDTPLSSDDSIRIKELVKEALALHLNTVKKRHTEKELNESLKSIVGEFLDCFIVLGYDLQGDPKIIRLAKTKQSEAALKLLFFKAANMEMYGHENNGYSDEAF
jgi:hypothetical protein